MRFHQPSSSEASGNDTEFVTNPVYRAYNLVFCKVFGHLLAQILDVRIDSSLISVETVTLDKIQKFSPSKYAIWTCHQCLEKSELVRGQAHRLSSDSDLTRGAVHRDRSHLEL